MRAHTAVRRLTGASTLKPEVIKGVDMVLVRELTGGIYFGGHERFYDEQGAGARAISPIPIRPPRRSSVPPIWATRWLQPWRRLEARMLTLRMFGRACGVSCV